MTLVLAYAGKDGALAAGDRRTLVVRMDEKKRKELEELLYRGEFSSEEEVKRYVEEELGIDPDDYYLEFHDDRKKVWKVNDEVVAGEVGIRSAKGVKRRRVYATPGAHAIVEMEGEEVLSKDFGGMALIVEGPPVVKDLVLEFIEDRFGDPSSVDLDSLLDAMDDLFDHVSSNTILVSEEYDVYHVEGVADPLAPARLQKAIKEDIERLKKHRRKLADEMLKGIREAYDLIDEGEVGVIVKVGTEEEGEGVEDYPPEKRIVVKLNDDVDARYMGDVIAGPGEEVVMAVEDPEKVEEGDVVVVEDGEMKVKGKDVEVVTGYSICRTRER